MTDWQIIIQEIAEKAADLGRFDYIQEAISNMYNVLKGETAYKIIQDTRENDKATFYEASESLADVGDDKIYQGETFDDLVARMAYWIIITKAERIYYHGSQKGMINNA